MSKEPLTVRQDPGLLRESGQLDVEHCCDRRLKVLESRGLTAAKVYVDGHGCPQFKRKNLLRYSAFKLLCLSHQDKVGYLLSLP